MPADHPTMHGSVRPATGGAPRTSVRNATIVHYAGLALAFCYHGYQLRSHWFREDDWVWIQHRRSGLHSLFAPYNGHWLTWPILAFRAQEWIFGLEFGKYPFLPYLIPLLVLYLAVAHLEWRVLQDVGVGIWIATGLAAALAFGGPFTFALTPATQTGWFGATLLGLVLVRTVNHHDPDRRRDVIAAAVAVLSLPLGSIALVWIGVVGLVVLIRRGWKPVGAIVGPAAIVYVIWLIAMGRSDVGRGGVFDAGRAASLFGRSVRDTFVHGTALPGVLAAVLAMVVVVGLVAHRRAARTVAAPVFAMAIGAVANFLLIIVGNALRASDTPYMVNERYTYTAWVLLLPAIGFLLEQHLTRTSTRRVACGCLVSALVVAAVVRERDGADRLHAAGNRWRMQVHDIASFTRQEPYLPDAIAVELDEDHRPAGFYGELAAKGELETRSLPPDVVRDYAPMLQIRVSDRAPRALRAGSRAAQCTDIRPDAGRTVRFTPTGRGVLAIRSDDGGPMRATPITDVDRIPRAVRFTAPAGRRFFLEYADVTEVALRLPPTGTTEICGLP